MNADPVLARKPHHGFKKLPVLRLDKFQLIHVFLPADTVPVPESAGNVLRPVDRYPEKPGFQMGFIYVVLLPGVILQKSILHGIVCVLPVPADAERGGKHPVAVPPERLVNR